MKDALALALVHFLWQGIVIGALGWGLMRFGRSAAVRYTIGVATLAAMLAAPVLTLALLAPVGSPVLADTATAPTAVTLPTGDALSMTASAPGSTPLALPAVPSTWILTAWLIGVSVLSARVAGGWVVARRLVTVSITPVSREIEDLATALAQRLGLRRIVRVLSSSRAAVPVMVGWWRPVVLIPASAISGMPLAQIEALLAHEFAHIRRHDYLVNLLQTMVETVCFYHPIVWWMSREVRRERELCCDDIAVGLCDRVTYVSALAHVASLATPRLAMAANGGSLRDRVQRLINSSTDSQPAKGGWMAMLPLVLVFSLFAPQAFTSNVTATEAGALQETRARQEAREQAAREARVREEVARKRTTQRDTVSEAAAQQIRERRIAEQAATRDAAKVHAVREMVERATEERRKDQEVTAVQAMDKARRAETEVEMGLAQLALEQSRRTLDRQRELVEKGLATTDGMAQAENRVLRAELDLKSAQARREIAVDRQARERAVAIGLDRQREYVAEVMDVMEERLGAPLPADATIRPSDLLEIVVSGEPELPRKFSVQADGSIRFPFLGVIRVQGSTVGQVRSAIRKLIVDKGLGANPSVTVAARGSR